MRPSRAGLSTHGVQWLWQRQQVQRASRSSLDARFHGYGASSLA